MIPKQVVAAVDREVAGRAELLRKRLDLGDGRFGQAARVDGDRVDRSPYVSRR